MNVSHLHTYGWIMAIYGMRLSWNSIDKSDTTYVPDHHGFDAFQDIGENDKALMYKLCKAGPSHRKFLRAIHIQCRVKAPFYWFTEFDTYKIGTTRLSSSTMHTITKRPLDTCDFGFDYPNSIRSIQTVTKINDLINLYNKTKSEATFRAIKQYLPSSYLYTSIIDFNYENFLNMYGQRHNHKLKEWKIFLDTIIEQTPLMEEIIEQTEPTPN